MARARRLFLTLASGSVLYSGMVPALGLGEISLNSALNQPLEAEIELLQVGDLTSSELSVRLAPNDVFLRAGVDRLQFLDDLRFTPLLRGERSVIRVVSNRPVREPYLNFVVEVLRPNGRLLREYTLLIDPPSNSATTPQAAQLPALTSAAAAPAMALPEVRELPPTTQGRRYTVVRGDSLWLIAKRLVAAGAGQSMPQLMSAIHALNPQAFIAGNMDRLKAGASLLLPDQDEPLATVSTVAAPDPVTAVQPAVQAEDVVPPVAAPSQNTEPLAEPAANEPAASTPAVAQDILAVQQRLDEVLSASERERLALQEQMNQLQAQLQALQAQVEQKDQQVRALQQELQAPVATTVEQPLESVEAVQLPAVPAPVAAENGSSGAWAWLAGLLTGSALVGLAGGLFWWRRRERMLVSVTAVQPAAAAVAAPRPVAAQPVRATASEQSPAAAAKPAAVARTAHREKNTEPDILEGARIYMAYGRYAEAREALQRGLAREPKRLDMRLMLLEVMALSADAEGFAEHEALWLAEGGDAGTVAQLRSNHPQLQAGMLESKIEDTVLPLAEEPVQTSVDQSAVNGQLNLDDLSLDADWGLVSPFEARPANKPLESVEEGFNSNLHELPVVLEMDEPIVSLDEHSSKLPAAEDKLDDSFLQAFADLPAVHSFDQLAGHPDNLSQLNQALAYIEQGNLEAACNILNQVISEGDDQQRQEARQILARIA